MNKSLGSNFIFIKTNKYNHLYSYLYHEVNDSDNFKVLCPGKVKSSFYSLH